MNMMAVCCPRPADRPISSDIAMVVDLDARIAAHNAGKGARYTASRRPVSLVYSEPAKSKSAALKREHCIKRWPKKKKEALVGGVPA